MPFHSICSTEHTVNKIVKGYKLSQKQTSEMSNSLNILTFYLRWILDFYPCLSYYKFFEDTINEDQLCAGIPSKSNLTIPFSGKHQEDFGGPLICLDKANQKPIFTGIASFNSLSTKHGQPGMIHNELYK